MSKVPHLKTMLTSRFISFAHKLINSRKFTTRFLSNLSLYDKRTVFGQNVDGILKSCNLQEEDFVKLSKGFVRNMIRYWPEDVEDCSWRIPIIEEIMELRSGGTEIDGFTHKELQEILTYVCTN